jgi:dihydrodipicolinate synthase/N-acetylneuraminate lyase
MARVARQLELRGVFASAVTPHRSNSQEPDFSGSLDLLDFLAQAGVQGICLFGETGEFFDYSLAQRQRVVYLGVKRSRVPLIAGVSHSTLNGAVQLASEAVASGANGLLLMPPFFFPYSQREIEEFYLQFADQVGDAVPIVIHNLPQSTSKLEIATVNKLVATGLFAGINDSSGDWTYLEQLLSLKEERPLAVLNGSDRLAVQALHAGADGLISSAASAVPELLVSLARAVPERRELLNGRLLEFTAWEEKFPRPVAVKRAVALRGQKSGPELTPLAPETKLLLEEFSRWFAEWLPLTQKAAANG